MIGLALALLLIALPAAFGLWHLVGGLWAVRCRQAAELAANGRRMMILWRDDPAPGLFRLWLVDWRLFLPRFAAGQHVIVTVALPDGTSARRAYSLAGWSRFPLVYCLGIRKGAAASAALHARARPLARLTVSAPKGQFTDPDLGAPLVLVAGGIGITPFRAILAERAGRLASGPVILHHSAREPAELLWKDDLTRHSARDARLRYIPRATQGQPRLTVAEVMADITPDSHVMICAGDSLTRSLREGLLEIGLPADRLHIEAFSLGLQPENLGISITIGDRSFRPGPVGSLLEALEQGGAAPESECRAGECGLCFVEILEGQARDIASGRPVSGRVLACSVIPETDLRLGRSV
ncbi:2Fe-2S iron-sulfur cluster-binding protein [Frigidibacter mobilis]|uniref:Putative oxidoreductase n=1 Tax=Frigidibacter mobilis TaxID=1335048 RepID=A0A165STR7_9RHOB|nr:2Fe-2S iron-sulfur cluster-binding protein [Frigidibacter mobilis]AMY70993.1 putative oxidoreductase [Frigidibacter mobilis]